MLYFEFAAFESAALHSFVALLAKYFGAFAALLARCFGGLLANNFFAFAALLAVCAWIVCFLGLVHSAG